MHGTLSPGDYSQVAAFAPQYAARAGIENTHAQGIHRGGLQHVRYRGLAKTHLQYLATAAALNVV
jgi:hypothetical protein